jgi:hypothetical protein
MLRSALGQVHDNRFKTTGRVNGFIELEMLGVYRRHAPIAVRRNKKGQKTIMN